MTTDWSVYDYEVMMYSELLVLQGTGGLPLCFALPVRNAVVESLLLHMRILAEMFLSLDNKTDAVNLRRFCPASRQRRLAP